MTDLELSSSYMISSTKSAGDVQKSYTIAFGFFLVSYLLRPNDGTSFGLLPKISSISSITSGVSFSMSCNALQLSWICSTFVAPKMTVLTFGLTAHHANANCVTLPPSRSAIAVNLRTLSIFARPTSVCNSLTVPVKKAELVAKRESDGIPSLYLPVSRPDAKGDQIVVP